MAVTAGTVWEVQATGNDNNGGAFDASYAGGSDMSAGSPAIYTGVLSTTGAGATTIASSGTLFTADMVGNAIQITGSTSGFQNGFYTITGFTDSTHVVLNGTPSSSAAGVGGTGRIGGPLATLVKPGTVAGNTVYVKAGAYTVTASQALSTSGTDSAPITYIGYGTTRGDGGLATVTRSGTGSLTIFNISGSWRRFYNFGADGNANSGSVGCFQTANPGNTIFINCRALHWTTFGFNQTSTTRCVFVNCHAGSGYAGPGFQNTAAAVNIYSGCVVSGSAGVGFVVNGTALGAGYHLFHRCIASGCVDGFRLTTSSGFALVNCVGYGNSSNGLLLDNSVTAAIGDQTHVENSIFVNNGLYGINSNTTVLRGVVFRYNAFWNNSSGARNSNLPAADNDITLTGDPFVDGANGNFALNNDAGEGAACRADAFPGTLLYGGTGYLDIGALQHQDSGGSGGGSGISRGRQVLG